MYRVHDKIVYSPVPVLGTPTYEKIPGIPISDEETLPSNRLLLFPLLQNWVGIPQAARCIDPTVVAGVTCDRGLLLTLICTWTR